MSEGRRRMFQGFGPHQLKTIALVIFTIGIICVCVGTALLLRATGNQERVTVQDVKKMLRDPSFQTSALSDGVQQPRFSQTVEDDITTYVRVETENNQVTTPGQAEIRLRKWLAQYPDRTDQHNFVKELTVVARQFPPDDRVIPEAVFTQLKYERAKATSSGRAPLEGLLGGYAVLFAGLQLAGFSVLILVLLGHVDRRGTGWEQLGA